MEEYILIYSIPVKKEWLVMLLAAVLSMEQYLKLKSDHARKFIFNVLITGNTNFIF
ncbi:hypothetical protein [Fictibacillus barbaricus]|uniref:Uncharacterized protein n=1 Tax=Fictibacillus barbaricus TaxID=182136 RepID=A0ABS2Z9W3_9BACL|nr:hypothetical protein [Fictibacillus barbaricus]MBN3544108.1 hypothetical protein [Fictibacillus barbaricus]GGB68995.1 hypothetical protein GCM10007199_38980 [Fictibacillus barbaricus]